MASSHVGSLLAELSLRSLLLSGGWGLSVAGEASGEFTSGDEVSMTSAGGFDADTGDARAGDACAPCVGLGWDRCGVAVLSVLSLETLETVDVV